jgi:hypothetical protein
MIRIIVIMVICKNFFQDVNPLSMIPIDKDKL